MVVTVLFFCEALLSPAAGSSLSSGVDSGLAAPLHSCMSDSDRVVNALGAASFAPPSAPASGTQCPAHCLALCRRLTSVAGFFSKSRAELAPRLVLSSCPSVSSVALWVRSAVYHSFPSLAEAQVFCCTSGVGFSLRPSMMAVFTWPSFVRDFRGILTIPVLHRDGGLLLALPSRSLSPEAATSASDERWADVLGPHTFITAQACCDLDSGTSRLRSTGLRLSTCGVSTRTISRHSPCPKVFCQLPTCVIHLLSLLRGLSSRIGFWVRAQASRTHELPDLALQVGPI